MIFNRTKKKDKVFGFFLSLLAAFLVICGITFLRVKEFSENALELKEEIRPIKDSLLLQDLPGLKDSLTRTKEKISSLEKRSRSLVFLSYLPFVRAYYSDLRHVLKATEELLDSAEVFVDTVMPYAPPLGFKGGNPQEPIAGGQERLAGLVKLAPVLTQNYGRINDGIHKARLEMKAVEPRRYPEKWLGIELRKNLELAKSLASDLDDSASDISGLLSELPKLLGETQKLSYLILFQNDKEIRPTGGFLTAYAVFTLEKGRIASVTSGDMYFLDIDNRVPFYPPAPSIIQTYLKIKDWYIRDANLSPDFKVSAETVEEFWNRVPGAPKVEGIIALDTHFVESLMSILGDITIPGYEKFTKDNVTYQLELFSTVIGSKLEKRQGRKDLIGILMQQLMQKAFSQSPKQYGTLISTVWREASQKHLLFYFHSKVSQGLAEKYNFAGRIKDFSGDYLHVNDANFAGRKANWFIVETISKTVERQGGKLISTLDIDYENTGDYDSDFNTGYRDYVRVYVPKGSRLISSSGASSSAVELEDLGKTVFASYIAVDPKKKTRLSLKYELPARLAEEPNYRLLIQKQPGTDAFDYQVRSGRDLKKFRLIEDKEIDARL